MAEVIKDDSESKDYGEYHTDEIQSIFRAMSLGELERTRDEKRLTVRLRKDGKPIGQPFVTVNPEYSKKLMLRKAGEGDAEMYKYLVKMTVAPGTQAMLEDPKRARVEQDNKPAERAYPAVPTRKKDERGVVVLKLEPLYEGRKEPRVLNFGIIPATMDDDDPLQMLNGQIVKIEVIGTVI